MKTPLQVEDLARAIDHTLLTPTATTKEVSSFLEEAQKYPFRSVCVAPTFVPLAREKLRDQKVKITTVVGFPLGFQLTSTKAKEAAEVVAAGAQEIDVVINLRWVKEGRLDFVAGELLEIQAHVPETPIKAIIECGYLCQEEKLRLVDVLADCRIAFVKTSTGFGPQGATVEDVRLLAQRASGRILVKAAGGIRTLKQALNLLEAGAYCLGTSAGVAILEELQHLRGLLCPHSPQTPQEGSFTEEIEVFVDGACLGNPGPGGFAAIIRSREGERVILGGEAQTTNNRMELLAAIKALESIDQPAKIRLWTDSRYLKEGITKWLPRWEKNGFRTAQGRPVKNQDLWKKLGTLARKHEIDWRWIPGHAGHPENERCDRLAREQAKKYQR